MYRTCHNCVVGASFCAAARNHKSKLPGLPMVPSTLTIAFKESKCTTYIYIYMYIVYIIPPDISINALSFLVVLFEAMMRNQIPIPTIH